MKITCERCGVEFDADGHAATAACPSCQHVNFVPAVSAAPREISLSPIDGDAGNDDDEPGGVAPVRPSGGRAMVPLRPEVHGISLTEDALGDVDFASLAAAPSSPTPPLLDLDDEPDLPAPVKKPLSPPRAPPPRLVDDADAIDLPAPKAASPKTVAPKLPPRPPMPPAKPPVSPALVDDGVDLPAPVAELPKPVARPKPPAMPGKVPPPPPLSPPATVSSPEMAPLDLDAPDVDDVSDLPTPRIDVDLPAPRADRSIDLPAPRVHRSTDLPQPRVESNPRVDSHEIEGLSDLLEPDAPMDEPRVAAAIRSAPDDKPRRSKLPLFIGGGALVLLAGGGLTAWRLGAFSDSGKAEAEAQLVVARRGIADDSMASFRKTLLVLKPLTSAEHPSEHAALLEAQVHFLEAHLGVTGELPLGKTLLDRPPSRNPAPADRAAAEGLRALDDGDAAAARTVLRTQVSAAPNDATALSYLGWVELEARDLVAAKAAFGKALAAEPTRAQAMYGLALVAERTGDWKAAGEGYGKTLAASADHTRARFGQLRALAHEGDGDASTKLEAVLASQSASFARGEIAEAHASLGTIAVEAGRRDEAEERFKKALSLDGDAAHSHVAWDATLGLARLRVQGAHPTTAIDDLRKLVALDARGIEPRLLLAEAVMIKGDTDEADTLLSAVEKVSPKDARLALLRGRLIESRVQVSADDRQKAVELYQSATVADPKLIEAWSALARVLYDQGKTPEALDALGKAAGQLGGNAAGAATIGEAYLAIGQPAEAERRFRSVLEGAKAGPEQLPVWQGLGESLEAQDKLDEAKKIYAQALVLAPKSALFIEKEARVAMRQNQLDEAKRLFDEALKIGTPTAPLRIAAAELALLQHRTDDAHALGESVVKDDDRSAVGNLVMAKAELDGGHPEDAVGLARRAAMLQDLPEAHFVLAEVLELTNKLEAAQSEFTLARRPPTTDRAALGRARVLVRMGNTKEALIELAPLAKSGPLRGDALVLEGDCFSDLQQSDKARHSYEDAMRAAPQSGDAAFKYGRALLDAGSRGPGIGALEHAVKLAAPKTPWLPDAWLLLADAYRMGKQNDAAIGAYKKYLASAPPAASMRGEAARQLELLGGTAP